LVTQYVPSATPGRRAPHVWLERGGERTSTIDLLGGRFVLLAGPRGEAWVEAASSMALPSRPELVAYTIGGDKIADPDGAWLMAYELEPGGAVLVRPDGYVCWRSRSVTSEPAAALAEAFDKVLGRS
jgi:putative polyketide hydroxylase